MKKDAGTTRRFIFLRTTIDDLGLHAVVFRNYNYRWGGRQYVVIDYIGVNAIIGVNFATARGSPPDRLRPKPS